MMETIILGSRTSTNPVGAHTTPALRPLEDPNGRYASTTNLAHGILRFDQDTFGVAGDEHGDGSNILDK
jgi:hypothetical protein